MIRWQSITVRDQSLLDEIRAAPVARIVTVTISWATPREGEQHEWLVVERETLFGSVEKSDWSVLMLRSARQELGTNDSAAREWQHAISDWSAEKLLEGAWEKQPEHWDLPGGTDVASPIADRLGSFQNQWHKLMLGEPVQFASNAVGLPLGVTATLSGIISKRRLPGDTLLKDLKRGVQITGAVAGLTTGNLHMAHACFASYTHDRITEIVSDKLVNLFTKQPEEPEQFAQHYFKKSKEGPGVEIYPTAFDEGVCPADGGKSHNNDAADERPQTTTTYDIYELTAPDEAQPTQTQPSLPSPSGTQYLQYIDRDMDD